MMIKKYVYTEKLTNEVPVDVVVTREEVEYMVCLDSMTQQEKDDAVQSFLREKEASSYSDAGFNEYQVATRSTAVYPPKQALEYLCLGIASEAGEIAGKMKKLIRDDRGFSTGEWDDALKAEIGDVLWYCARLADEIGAPLSVIAEQNMEKLLSRKERGKLGGSGDNR
jgi:NTP pyrophosphatase (non-canonical NTP hydrolase)